MKKDGKWLENLVRRIEALFLPQGLLIKSNRKEFREINGKRSQIAEFDIEIRGRLGSTDVVWLIECRDRPSEGPAPGEWIEQLVGRRKRFGFTKVIAVSTTGFAPGALEYATEEGIELKHVHEITAEGVRSWYATQELLV